MIVAAFCPSPPVLIPQVARGAAADLDELRAACRAAITRIARPQRRVVVLGPGPLGRGYPPNAWGTLAGFGVALDVPLGRDEPGPVQLPLSLTVGAWLVRDALGPDHAAVGFAVADGAPELAPGDVALVVIGDGSARRSTAAPGYFDERADGFDAQVAAALASGDPHALRDIDAALGAELLAAGVPAWHAAAALLGSGRYTAEVLYAGAPYGVGYFAAVWT